MVEVRWRPLIAGLLGLYFGYLWGKQTTLERISVLFEEPNEFAEYVETQRVVAEDQ